MLTNVNDFSALITLEDSILTICRGPLATVEKYNKLRSDPKCELVYRMYGPYGSWDRNVAWAIIIESYILGCKPPSLEYRRKEWKCTDDDIPNFCKANGIRCVFGGDDKMFLWYGDVEMDGPMNLETLSKFFIMLGCQPNKNPFEATPILDRLDRDLDGASIRGLFDEPEDPEDAIPKFNGMNPAAGVKVNPDTPPDYVNAANYSYEELRWLYGEEHAAKMMAELEHDINTYNAS